MCPSHDASNVDNIENLGVWLPTVRVRKPEVKRACVPSKAAKVCGLVSPATHLDRAAKDRLEAFDGLVCDGFWLKGVLPAFSRTRRYCVGVAPSDGPVAEAAKQLPAGRSFLETLTTVRDVVVCC
jgi:hypothetical protein